MMGLLIGVVVLCILLLLVGFVWWFIAKAQRAKKIEKAQKADYVKNIPLNANFNTIYMFVGNFSGDKQESSIVLAYLLKWICSRQVEIEKVFADFVHDQSTADLQLYAARSEMGALEKRLYEMFLDASDQDFIISIEMLLMWAREHSGEVNGWLKRVEEDGKKNMARVEEQRNRSQENYDKNITIEQEIFGFQNYLKKFLVINNGEVVDKPLWSDYLSVAALYGIEQEFATQISDICPAYYSEILQESFSKKEENSLHTIKDIVQMVYPFSNALIIGKQSGEEYEYVRRRWYL